MDLLKGHRVAVALSGGADSAALVFQLIERAAIARHEVTVAGVIHVNHGLRGAESARDEEFCRALALRIGLPIDVTRVDVAAEARAARRSLESAARLARYRVFREAAARLGATRVATAHTADDQAETVLMRLLRGAGSRGVSGIRAERGLYVRPLLDQRRGDLRARLRHRGESFCGGLGSENGPFR